MSSGRRERIVAAWDRWNQSADPTIKLIDALLALVDAEVEAMRERCIAKAREFDADRFTVSHTWRDNMSASEIYGTGVADAAAFIAMDLAALPIKEALK